MFKKLILLMFALGFSTASAADSLYRYEGGVRMYYPVDTTRLLIKWKPFATTFDQTGFLSSYSSISAVTYVINAADQYFMHYLIGANNFDAVVSLLEADINVVAVNKALITPDGRSMYYGDQIVCRFNAEVPIAYVDSLCQANQLLKLETSPYVSNQFVLATTAQSPLGMLDMANYLWELPTTVWSHPNCRGNATCYGYNVIDTFFHSSQWTTKKSIGYVSTSNYGAWELTRGSNSVRVAVLDQGMEPHEDFDTSLWDGGFDFMEFDMNPAAITPEPDSVFEGHGMAVLGIIAAKHNNAVPIGNEESSYGYQSVAGGAPIVTIIPLRIFDAFSDAGEDRIANAIRYATLAGADIINCSWGYPNPPDVVVDAINQSALEGRDGKGCVIVAAAGNYAQALMGYPAKSPYAISVAAVRASDQLWSYSSFGFGLDVVAPSGPICIGKESGGTCSQDGTNYFFTTDRMDGWGYNNKQFGSCLPTQDKDYSCTFGGTSGASPNVASGVALLLSIEPTLTRAQVVDIVRTSASKKLAWGVIQPSDSVFYGQGRANALYALSTVRRGDCNASGTINVVDVNYLSAYLFSGGPAPFPDMNFGDANCNGGLNVTDLTFLVNYLFKGGPPPAKPCTVFLPE